MAREYPAIDISRDPALVKLADEVSKTKKAQTIRLSDDVIAVRRNTLNISCASKSLCGFWIPIS